MKTIAFFCIMLSKFVPELGTRLISDDMAGAAFDAVLMAKLVLLILEKESTLDSLLKF